MSKKRADKFVYDEAGKLVGVILEPTRYRSLLSALEELDSIRAYDEAKASNDDVLDYEEAIAQIEGNPKTRG